MDEGVNTWWGHSGLIVIEQPVDMGFRQQSEGLSWTAAECLGFAWPVAEGGTTVVY